MLETMKLNLWEDVFVQYNCFVDQKIFARHKDDSIFSCKDQLQILNEIITADKDFGGAELRIIELAMTPHPVVAVFAIDDFEKLEKIILPGVYWNFFLPNNSKWVLTLKNLRNYYGEKIAFYFAFLQYYQLWLVFPTILGIGLFVA